MATWSERLVRVRAQIAALPRPVRVVAVAVVGGTVVLTGVAMLVLPGPGILTIVAGLALLATEFAWARRWLDRAKATGKAGVDKGREAWQRRRGTGPAPRVVVVDDVTAHDAPVGRTSPAPAVDPA